MLLMTLRSIKKMLDRALEPFKPGGMLPVDDVQKVNTTDISTFRANVENAKDLLEELIKEKEKVPVAPPAPVPGEIEPILAVDVCQCVKYEDRGDGICKLCEKKIDYQSKVLG